MVVKIVEILENEGVIYVKFKTEFGASLCMVALLENLTLALKQKVVLGFKSTNVILSPKQLQSSLSNEIFCKIESIDFGKILSVVLLRVDNFCFESVITTASAKRLNLKKDDEIYAYIKATSLFIKEIL